MNVLKITLACMILAGSRSAFAQVDKKVVNAFIKRIVPFRASDFAIEIISRESDKDVFELESRHRKIILRGSNGIGIASALNYYLKNYCHTMITWDNPHATLPAVLPSVREKVHKETPYRYRYYLNYCTFNYSMAWWNWDRWQQEIDWMSLNGINMPLAITGEEAIWQQVYKDMGFTKEELDSFFCGPAYFSWFWMGNLDAWGGPLPQHWMDTHKELQKKILAAERSMGMTPVLAAFTGHVPPSFTTRFPGAKVKRTNWGAGFSDVSLLDPADPAFETIGKAFLDAQTKEYGTDHFYSADTFNENVPPTNDSTYLSAMSKEVFASMSMADPKAVWVMQGWMFHYNASFWKKAQVQALVRAVPDDHMIILDLYSESHPLWNRTEAYYGKPWIWNMLHNFGGNVSLWGRMSHAARDPASALHDPASGSMMGIGLTPEGIEQNPALYQLMLENVWRDQPVDLPAWLQEYALQRYGSFNTSVNQAWAILERTVYRGGLGEGGPESIIVARPTINPWSDRVRTKLDYPPMDLVTAWELFVKAAPELQQSEGFQYDLVDLTRQVLANYAAPLQQQFVLAYLQDDTASYDRYTAQFIELMTDMDALLNTRKEFLLGKWISEARANGIDNAEKDLYEFNARNIITLWGSKESGLHEYSNRQWAGLINDFYRPRWEQFISYLKKKMNTGGRMETDDFEALVRKWEWDWVNDRSGNYPSVPTGDPIAVSRRLFDKYRARINNQYAEK